MDNTEKIYKILGYTEHVTECDCCGRTDLKGTIALESNGGDINYFGTTCGAKIANYTVKVFKEHISEEYKNNLKKASVEYRSSAEHANYEAYINSSNEILETLDDYELRKSIIVERIRFGDALRLKRQEIATKYFIKYPTEFN